LRYASRYAFAGLLRKFEATNRATPGRSASAQVSRFCNSFGGRPLLKCLQSTNQCSKYRLPSGSTRGWAHTISRPLSAGLVARPVPLRQSTLTKPVACSKSAAEALKIRARKPIKADSHLHVLSGMICQILHWRLDTTTFSRTGTRP